MAEYQIQADAVFEDGERSSYRPKRLKVLSSLAMPAVLLTVVYIRGTSGEISLNTPAVNPVTERFIKVTGSVHPGKVDSGLSRFLQR